MKEMKTTAQVLVDCLEAEGVDVMFGIPGEETLDLMFAIRDSKIRFIPVRRWWPSRARSALTGCPEVTIIYKRASVCPVKAADALLII